MRHCHQGRNGFGHSGNEQIWLQGSKLPKMPPFFWSSTRYRRSGDGVRWLKNCGILNVFNQGALKCFCWVHHHHHHHHHCCKKASRKAWRVDFFCIVARTGVIPRCIGPFTGTWTNGSTLVAIPVLQGWLKMNIYGQNMLSIYWSKPCTRIQIV